MPRAKAGVAPTGVKKPRAPKGLKLPAPFAEGTILLDLKKKEWKLGKEIGQGGFGLIYLASDDTSSDVGPSSEYVIKIEPLANGPLFCELHFYQRIAKPELIEDWTKSRKLKYLGVPKYIAHGSHQRGSETFRFMVMPRFGSDLQKIFENSGKKFSKETVLNLGLRMVDSLEYLHENSYVHADIKASNILLGFSGKEQVDQVFLVDYGLAVKYAPDGTHKPYKEDPRKAHDGTIEFTSTDAHKGVVRFKFMDSSDIQEVDELQKKAVWGRPRILRKTDMDYQSTVKTRGPGDFRILYATVLCSTLPWEDNLTDKNYVRDSKIKYMNDIPSLMKKCFPSGNTPDEIAKFLVLICRLNYDEKPDYNKYRSLFRDGLKKLGIKDEWRLKLPMTEVSSPRTRKRDAQAEVSTPKRMAVDKSKPQNSTPKGKFTVKEMKPQKNNQRGTPRGNTPKSLPSKSKIVSKTLVEKAKSPQKGLITSSVSRQSPVKSRKNIPSPKRGTDAKVSTRRRVKRSKAPKVDACIQTSPP